MMQYDGSLGNHTAHKLQQLCGLDGSQSIEDQGKVDRKVQEQPKTKILKEQKTQCMINILEQ